MRDNSFDRTIERNYIQKWRFLIAEYEAVKEGRSTQFRRVGDFYRSCPLMWCNWAVAEPLASAHPMAP